MVNELTPGQMGPKGHLPMGKLLRGSRGIAPEEHQPKKAGGLVRNEPTAGDVPMGTCEATPETGRGEATNKPDLACRRPNGQFGPGNRMGTLSRPPKSPVPSARNAPTAALLAAVLTDEGIAADVQRLHRIIAQGTNREALEAFKLLYGQPRACTQEPRH